MTYGEGTATSDQPFKYNGKELDQMHGLNWYDYEARMYNGYRFPTPDPLADKYPDLSPYAYCANNPVRFIDPDGKDLWDVMLGTAHAIGENLTLGLAQYDNSSVSSASDYNAGRSIGDVVSVVMGALEIGAGGSVSGGGVAVAVGSGGSLSLIGVPVAAEGVAVATHGAGVIGNALKNFSRHNKVSADNLKENGSKKKKNEAREAGDVKRGKQRASDAYVKFKAEGLENKGGRKARRKAHDAKDKGAPDRTKKQIDEDYEF